MAFRKILCKTLRAEYTLSCNLQLWPNLGIVPEEET
jgi:hypothetical protein